MTKITRLLIMKVTTLCIALLYPYRTHTFAQIFIKCSRINYVSKSNCKNSMLCSCNLRVWRARARARVCVCVCVCVCQYQLR